MKRFAALILVLCSGCASGEDNLLRDSFIGDIIQSISGGHDDTSVRTVGWSPVAPPDGKAGPPAGANQ